MRYDAIVIGAGPSGMGIATSLQKQGKECCVITTGRSVYGYDATEFKSYGGTVLMGDEIVGSQLEGHRVKAVFSKNLGKEEPLQADEFYLATGKFLSGGLKADMHSVYEPVFGIDVLYDPDRNKWFSEKFNDHQPFMDFGVKVTQDGCALLDGEPINNLFPVGDIIAR